MHEKILSEIELIKSNKRLSPQEKIDSLFDIKNEFARPPFFKELIFESRVADLLHFLLALIFLLVTLDHPEIILLNPYGIEIPVYVVPIIGIFLIFIITFKKIRRIRRRYSHRVQLILGETKNYGVFGEEVLAQFADTGNSLDSIAAPLKRSEQALISKLRSMNLYDQWQNNFYEKHQSNIRKIGKKFTKENYQEMPDLHLQKTEWRNYLKALIKNGESRNVEYKASYDTCIKTGGIKIGLRQGIWKTLNAFMNTKGGYLFIGVEDEEPYKIIGLEHDPHRTDDQWVRHINTHLQKVFEPYALEFIEIFLEKIDGKRIIFFQVEKSGSIVSVKLEKNDPDLPDKLKNQDLYFKRLINENSRLEGKDLLKHRDEFFLK